MGYCEPDRTITQCVLSFGDGSADVTSESAPSNLLHTYSSVGNYTATLIATDSGGARGGATVDIAVSAGPLGLIAFTSNRDGNWEIYVMNADGTGQTNLTNNPACDWSPAWRP